MQNCFIDHIKLELFIVIVYARKLSWRFFYKTSVANCELGDGEVS